MTALKVFATVFQKIDEKVVSGCLCSINSPV